MAVNIETFTSAEEASRHIQTGGNARIFGGGTLLMAAINGGAAGFERVIRICDPEMTKIRAEGGSVRIGAGVTMTQIVASSDLAFLAPVARAVGGPAVRNMATVGGNLFAPSPYGDLATALLALHASIQIAGQSGAPIGMDEFLRDRRQYTDRIVASVSVNRPREPNAFRWLKISRVQPKGVSVLSIAAHVPQSGGGARIAFGNMGPTPLRAIGAERALEGKPLNSGTIDQAASAVLEGLSPATDPLASEWYRREIAPVHLRRLLAGRPE